MEQSVEGRIWLLGDDIDTDLIYPGKYLPILDPNEMARHALEGYAADFPTKLRPGDIIVAGSGFGCGSSREQAATSLKMAGVGAVVAVSFARIFFRNAVNQGLPLVQVDIRDRVIEGDRISIDFGKSTVNGVDWTSQFAPLDPFVMSIIEMGGLVPAVKRKLGR